MIDRKVFCKSGPRNVCSRLRPRDHNFGFRSRSQNFGVDAGLWRRGLISVAVSVSTRWWFRSTSLSFLVSLAIADVVFLLVCLPYELIVKLEAVWHGGLALCKLAGFVEMTTAAASVLNLTAVSIERFDFLAVLYVMRRAAASEPVG